MKTWQCDRCKSHVVNLKIPLISIFEDDHDVPHSNKGPAHVFHVCNNCKKEFLDFMHGHILTQDEGEKA